MKRRLIGLVAFSAFIPMTAYAQTQPPACEQRLAVMEQLVGDLSRARAVVSTAEVEAASLKVQVKMLKDEIEAMKQTAEKRAEKKTGVKKAN